jgi:hypothetical protein
LISYTQEVTVQTHWKRKHFYRDCQCNEKFYRSLHKKYIEK